jgi:hypothetical protein
MCFFFIKGSRLTCCAVIIFAASWMPIPASAVFKGDEEALQTGSSRDVPGTGNFERRSIAQ